LTAALAGAGVLTRGSVVASDARPVGASSQVAHLAVRYSADAPSDAPAHLFLKVADPDLERRMPRRNRAEVAFYRAVAGDARDLPLVRCYDAAYAGGDVDRFHLLLADPAATTHVAIPYSAVPPPLAECHAMIDTLARVHARYWDDPRPAAPLQQARSAERHTGMATAEFVAWADETLPRFLADLAEHLPADRRALYAAVGARLPARLVACQARGRHLTLTHGDVHRGNFLFPRDAASHTPVIIDWKRAGVTLGANDLAYMMALCWFPPIRAQREQPLLRRYHERLREHGVAGYAWADLWDDYRLAVLRQLFEAVWGWSARQNSLIWWNHLERITAAITDLRCLAVV
ncbi:MAG TPA: phosphotransferase, partial [Thermomicrobiales bacterium]|nr:phosphotransferase [Thermomicrobiales bacterium]